MFSVKFGTTTDLPFVLNKSYNFTYTKNMKPRGEVDILNPVFIIAYDSNIISCNYAEITTWGKLYFVKTSIMTDGRMRVELTVDPLTSNLSDINKITATIIRSGFLTKPTNVTDPKLPIEPNKKEVSVKNFNGATPHSDGTSTAVHLLIHTI